MQNNKKTVMMKQIAEILDRLDMSGYDPRVHGDYNENIAEYLMANDVVISPIQSRSDLIKILADANTAWLNHLDEIDQKGLINNESKNSFVADYILSRFDPDHDLPDNKDYVVIRSESESGSIEVFGAYSLSEAKERLREIYDEIYEDVGVENVVEDVSLKNKTFERN